jgi:hypothetical protein
VLVRDTCGEFDNEAGETETPLSQIPSCVAHIFEPRFRLKALLLSAQGGRSPSALAFNSYFW